MIAIDWESSACLCDIMPGWLIVEAIGPDGERHLLLAAEATLGDEPYDRWRAPRPPRGGRPTAVVVPTPAGRSLRPDNQEHRPTVPHPRPATRRPLHPAHGEHTMTNPLIPEVVQLAHGLRAVYLSHELAAIQRSTTTDQPDAIDTAEGTR